MRAWPTLRQEFRFGHDAVTMLDEIEEDGKHFGLYRHQLPGLTQLIARGIEFARAKAIDHALSPCMTGIRWRDQLAAEMWGTLLRHEQNTSTTVGKAPDGGIAFPHTLHQQ
jgi:hypothetical protein